MTSTKEWAIGIAGAAALYVGYSLFPSGTLFEWTVTAVAFVAGMTWNYFFSPSVSWREASSAALVSCFFIAVGLCTRMWLNNSDFLETALLRREEKFVFGSLLPIGYWMLAGTAGFTSISCLRTLLGKHNGPK